MIKLTMKNPTNALCRAIVPAIAAAVLLSSTSGANAAASSEVLALRTGAATRDIEQVTIDTFAVANQIGSGSVKLTKVNIKTLAKQQADEILGKAVPTPGFPNSLSIANKADELGELASAILAGIDNNASFSKLGVAKSYIVLIAKGVLKSVKVDPNYTTATAIFRDVAGSLASTIRTASVFDANEEKIQKFLFKKAKSIAGKAGSSRFQEGITEGFDTPATADLKYENANAVPELITVKDPETDQRNA
jgi:hypothetical protein